MLNYSMNKGMNQQIMGVKMTIFQKTGLNITYL